VGLQPDTLSVVLLSRKEGIKIDEKQLAKWGTMAEGIFVERLEEEILSLARQGESQTLEYKYDVIDDKQKNDFIESVVAFLNKNRGIILVGVDDKGNVVGSQKHAEDIRRIIHDCCDPPPASVKVEEQEIAGGRVIVVEVPKGEAKPYQSKRDKNWYVRHNANDMKMERSELVYILRKRDLAQPQ